VVSLGLMFFLILHFNNCFDFLGGSVYTFVHKAGHTDHWMLLGLATQPATHWHCVELGVVLLGCLVLRGQEVQSLSVCSVQCGHYQPCVPFQ
jgi:hypothetical protein